jgi:glycosyltransferase involved in cell wall biosynthesis
LSRLIPRVLSQSYTNFEFIVADDFSDMDIPALIDSYHDDRLRLTRALKDLPGKKAVLAEAISKASHELILVTDSDCKPASDQWIRSMVSHLDEGKDIVLGYSPVQTSDKSILAQLISYENWLVAVQYFSYAISGIPYMGVGRNMLFRKSVFQAGNGFYGHRHLVSGDDDMFVQQHASAANIAWNMDKESFVYTNAPQGIASWLRQKRRHGSTSFYYRWYHQVLLFIYAGSHISLYVSLVAIGFVSVELAFWAAWSLIGLWMFQYICAKQIMKSLPMYFRLKSWPILDIAMMAYYWMLAFELFFNKKEMEWKS